MGGVFTLVWRHKRRGLQGEKVEEIYDEPSMRTIGYSLEKSGLFVFQPFQKRISGPSINNQLIG